MRSVLVTDNVLMSCLLLNNISLITSSDIVST